MADKMGGSKCRRRGARKDSRGINARRKAGLPAKAGKRKVYGKNSTRKSKLFGDGNGFRMASSNKFGYPRDSGYALNPMWKTGEPVWVKVA